MKRGAEKQLSKDDNSDNEDQEETTQTGFKKADEEALAKRKIRALPKRATGGAASVASPSPASESSAGKFTGFSGLGGSNSFTLPPTSSTITAASTSLFPSPHIPALSTAATSTAKTLSSLLATSSNTPTTSTSPLFASPITTPSNSSSLFSPASITSFSATVHPAQKDSSADPAELKYYTSLRGLNESLRACLQRVLDDDPFLDISVLLERYKSLRADIQKDYDQRSTSLDSESTSTTTAPAPLTKTFSMPTPPSGAFKFSGTTFSSETKSTKAMTDVPSGGFTPSFSLPKGGFTFGKGADQKPTDSPEPNTSREPSLSATSDAPPFSVQSSEVNKRDISSPNPFSDLGKPTSTSNPPPSIFSLGGSTTSVPSKPDASVVSFGAPKLTKAFSFTTNSNSSPFGGDKDTGNPIVGSPALASSSVAIAPAPSFSFGTTASNTAAGTNSTNNSSAQTSRFAGFAGFGKPSVLGSGSNPTPVGFNFGASPLSTAMSGAAKLDPGEGSPAEAGSDDAPKKNVAESFALNADNKHDLEGAGEEDEETMHAVKLKAYVMKDEKGAKNWVELGYGVLRIKKHKGSGSRRILLRSSSTGQILMNFAFHSAFKPTHKNKNITFLGYDSQHNSKMYTLKLQAEQQAIEFKEALDREIKAKDESS